MHFESAIRHHTGYLVHVLNSKASARCITSYLQLETFAFDLPAVEHARKRVCSHLSPNIWWKYSVSPISVLFLLNSSQHMGNNHICLIFFSGNNNIRKLNINLSKFPRVKASESTKNYTSSYKFLEKLSNHFIKWYLSNIHNLKLQDSSNDLQAPRLILRKSRPQDSQNTQDFSYNHLPISNTSRQWGCLKGGHKFLAYVDSIIATTVSDPQGDL